MNFRIRATLFIALVANAAAAQETADTVQRHVAEVVVTGSRTSTDVRHLSQTVSVISRSKMESRLQPTLLPVLSEQVPGLFTTARGIMGYGVSDGAAGGISIRGLGGGAARIMVLIDGHPQYAGIFGHPIADAYQTLMADKVEVLRGPASVLYGSNAMGGVINIVTRNMHADGVQTHARIGYGSFNTLESEATCQMRSQQLSGTIGAQYNRTDGHRTDMQFEQYGGIAKVSYEAGDHWTATADVNLTHFNASYPGPEQAPLIDGDQRITRGVASASVRNSYKSTQGAISAFYNWGDHWINDGYTPSANETPQEGRFNSTDNMMGISAYQSTTALAGSRITLGADIFRYGGKAYTKYVTGSRAGTTKQLVDKHENEIAAYIDWRHSVATVVTFNAGLRIDHHSRVGTEWIPQFGAALHLPSHINLKLSASKGFRYPILREMYMFPPQNPNLKPESAWNYELALSQSLIDGRLTYGANIFYIDGKNLIQTLPNPNGTGKLNQNSGAIENAGIELTAAFRVSDCLSADANYSYLHMEHPVIAAPEHKLYVGASYQYGKLSISGGLQYIHGLITQLSDKETESFALLNIRASFQATSVLSIYARGENLLAQKYQINYGYPMPRATAMAGISISI